MREILFRGKRVDNGEWAESEYPYGTMSCGVVCHDFDHDTIGQFTGLTDKNGVKIFEGDIVKGTAYSAKFVGIIVWIDEIGGFGVRYRKRQEATAWENSSILKRASEGRTGEFTAEIIGNIYDSPELDKGGNKNV
jgi:uncharacterized phage protein (TIGR01671 family)